MKNKKTLLAVVGALVTLLTAVYSYLQTLPEAEAPVEGAAGAPAVVVPADAGATQ